MNFAAMLFTAIGFLSIFLILSVIALICAKPGRKVAWVLYWVGAGLTALSLIGTLMGGRSDPGLVLMEIALFAGCLILFGILIRNKMSREDHAEEPKPAAAPQKAGDASNSGVPEAGSATVSGSQSAKDVLSQQQAHYDSLVKEKETDDVVPEDELIRVFATYFAPNKAFYMPGSTNAQVYFSAVNAARNELLQNSELLSAATHWTAERYRELVQNPPPGLGNMMICGLIFKTGEFAVVKDMVYCVDFAEAVPNCIALYLLLIAQKQPENQRTQIIDAGTGTNREPLTKAMNALRVLDPKWDYKIW